MRSLERSNSKSHLILPWKQTTSVHQSEPLERSQQTLNESGATALWVGVKEGSAADSTLRYEVSAVSFKCLI